MKKYKKLLKQIRAKDSERITKAVQALCSGDVHMLDVVKLDAHNYRLRVGAYRVLFHYEDSAPVIDDIRRRSEKTYRR